jgi:transcription initiation factor TFIIH subunit 1
MSSSSQAFLHAAVSCQKLPGTLVMEKSGMLRWTPSSSGAASSAISIDQTTIMSISVSKEGAPQTVMMLQLAEGVKATKDGKSKVLFHFNGNVAGVAEDKVKAAQERNAFKDYLAEVVADNKARAATSAASTGNATPAAASSPAVAGSSAAASPGPSSALRRQAAPGRDSLSTSEMELQLRIRVLKANPSLATLHKDVVMSKQITDAEFWSHPTRRALLQAERASLTQRQGRNARIADPRPASNEQGETKINMTPELVRDLKSQYPVVARAFDENVPSVMDEASFWQRYFSSKLYHRLRASARSSASQHTVREDEIFDKYLEAEDDQLEPKRQYNAHDALLDLASTEEDHGETGNEKDWTMRAGAERKTLPLMRRFNDHSSSLLDSALGEQEEVERRKKRRVTGGVGEEYPEEEEEYDAIVIDELEEDESHERILLNMREQRQVFQNNLGAREGARRGEQGDGLDEAQVVKMIDETAINRWKTQLDDYAVQPKGTEAAMKAMLGNIRARTESKSWKGKGELPDDVSKQVTSYHSSTTEFLLQFWSAITPQPLEDGSMPSTAASQPRERKLKAQRMLTSLQKNVQKVEAISQAAESRLPGSGSDRIKSALGPTENAINKALSVSVGER